MEIMVILYMSCKWNTVTLFCKVFCKAKAMLCLVVVTDQGRQKGPQAMRLCSLRKRLHVSS